VQKELVISAARTARFATTTVGPKLSRPLHLGLTNNGLRETGKGPSSNPSSPQPCSPLVGWTTVTRRHPIGICRSRYSTRAKVTTAIPLARLWVRQSRGNSAHDNQFSLDRISPGGTRRLSPHTPTQIYPRSHRAHALRRLPHLPGVAAKRQTT